jgi:hypothetical protein
MSTSVNINLISGSSGPLPESLDSEIQAALEAANAPDADNPFATIADLSSSGAALIDLTGGAALTITGIAGGATADATWTTAGLSRGIIVRLTASAASSTSLTIRLHSTSARTSSDLLYEAAGINGVIGHDDRIPFYVEGPSELYVRIINTSEILTSVTLSAYALGE